MRPLRYPLNTLMSYHYAKQWPINQFANEGQRIIADSGAFSAESQGATIDIDAFAEWSKQWREHFCWVASLDVIGNANASWENYKILRGKYALDVIPTVHYGAEPETMDRYANDGVDFMGLGGMVSRKSSPDQLLRWALSMFIYARDNHPQMRFHGWGVTHKTLLTLPWYSVDSSGFGSAYMYARALLINPTTNESVTYNLNGKEAYDHTDLLKRYYGVSPQEVAVSGPHNAELLARMMAKTAQNMEDAVRRKHRVKPPKYGDIMPGVGTHVHYASGSKFVIESFSKLKEAKQGSEA